jgi:mono/diheme cytochrome c family protein
VPVTLLVVVALLAGACRQDMHDQAKLEPLEASPLFADGAGSRTPPAGTVARGELRDDDRLYLGRDADGSPISDLPVPLTAELLATGHKDFDVFCSPCHDRLGEGRGMVVRRGFKQPPSFHQARLRQLVPGYLFTVMTNGFGQMPSYADKLTPEERWAVVAYIRALQLSQDAPAALLSESDLASLAAAERESALQDGARNGAKGAEATEATEATEQAPQESPE